MATNSAALHEILITILDAYQSPHHALGSDLDPESWVTFGGLPQKLCGLIAEVGDLPAEPDDLGANDLGKLKATLSNELQLEEKHAHAVIHAQCAFLQTVANAAADAVAEVATALADGGEDAPPADEFSSDIDEPPVGVVDGEGDDEASDLPAPEASEPAATDTPAPEPTPATDAPAETAEPAAADEPEPATDAPAEVAPAAASPAEEQPAPEGEAPATPEPKSAPSGGDGSSGTTLPEADSSPAADEPKPADEAPVAAADTSAVAPDGLPEEGPAPVEADAPKEG